VDERLAREMVKLKTSIVEFSKALSQKTIKIPIPTEEELKKEELKKQNEINNTKNKKTANSWDVLVQRTESMRQGVKTINRGLRNWSKLAAKILKSRKEIRQFEEKKMAECSEDELMEAFKYALDILVSIVKPKPFIVPDADDFLFHKKATAVSLKFKF